MLMYVIAFLDRANVAFAQQEFEVNFGISAAAYAFGAGLFFVGYAVFEIPSNLLLHKVGARWWLARIMVSWGIVSAALHVRSGTDQLLRPAVPAGCHGGRLLPRGDPVPDLLGSRSAPQPGPRVLLHGTRHRRNSGQPGVRWPAGTQRPVRTERHPVDVPRRGLAGGRGRHLVLSSTSPTSPRTRPGCPTTSDRH